MSGGVKSSGRTNAVSSVAAWGGFAKLMHWSSLLLLVAVLAAVWASETMPNRTQAETALQFHRALGLTIFAVTALRLFWRWCRSVPPSPANLPVIHKCAARATQYLLYILLLALPILGLAHSNAAGEQVDFYLLGELPPIVGRNQLVAQYALRFHEIAALLLMAVVALHAAAALFHHYVRRDGMLTAMLPQRNRNVAASSARRTTPRGRTLRRQCAPAMRQSRG